MDKLTLERKIILNILANGHNFNNDEEICDEILKQLSSEKKAVVSEEEIRLKVKSLLLYVEQNGELCNGFRTKEIMLELKQMVSLSPSNEQEKKPISEENWNKLFDLLTELQWENISKAEVISEIQLIFNPLNT